MCIFVWLVVFNVNSVCEFLNMVYLKFVWIIMKVYGFFE